MHLLLVNVLIAKRSHPSTELREWFGHKPERFSEFSVKYEEELRNNPAADEPIKLIKTYKIVTLVYAARDTKNNYAAVLKQHLESRID